MTDLFKNPDEWEQTYPNQLDGPAGHVYDARTQTYWRRKPQEPTYTLPSDEAKALYRKVFGHVAPKFSAATRYIDQALDAARQQGRDEAERENENKSSRAYNNGYRGGRLDARRAAEDGSTVASPLRGRCSNCQQPIGAIDYGHFDPKAQRYTCTATDCTSQWHQIRTAKRAVACPLCGAALEGED